MIKCGTIVLLVLILTSAASFVSCIEPTSKELSIVDENVVFRLHYVKVKVTVENTGESKIDYAEVHVEWYDYHKDTWNTETIKFRNLELGETQTKEARCEAGLITLSYRCSVGKVK